MVASFLTTTIIVLFTPNTMKFFVRKVTVTTKQLEVMTLSNVTLGGIVKNNREVLRKTTNKKQNCLVWNRVENILLQKSFLTCKNPF